MDEEEKKEKGKQTLYIVCYAILLDFLYMCRIHVLDEQKNSKVFCFLN